MLVKSPPVSSHYEHSEKKTPDGSACDCTGHSPKSALHGKHSSNSSLPQQCCCNHEGHMGGAIYQHVPGGVNGVMADTSKPGSGQDQKSTPQKHGAIHYCSSCPPGPHTHHMYPPASCHPQPAYMDHGHCGCQPGGYLDTHYHYPHHPQRGPPRPMTVVTHPPPLLLRPIQPQHIQQHQVGCVEHYLLSPMVVYR